MRNALSFNRCVAVALCLALVISYPGPAAANTVARVVTTNAPAAAFPVAPVVGQASMALQPLRSAGISLGVSALPSLLGPAPVSMRTGGDVAALNTGAGIIATGRSLPTFTGPAAVAKVAPRASVAKTSQRTRIAGLSKSVAHEISAVGNVAEAPARSAFGLGTRLQDLLSGRFRSRSAGSSVLVPAGGGMASLAPSNGLRRPSQTRGAQARYGHGLDRYAGFSRGSRSDAPAESAIFRKVFAWMTAGLAITGGVSWWMMSSGGAALLAANTPVFIALIVTELIAVFALAAFINRMSPATAKAVFFLYAGLNGVTLAPFFALYTLGSIAAAFLVTAGMFGSMAAYGYLTKADLSRWGSLLFMGLVGIVLASIVNLFLQSSGLAMALNYIAVLVFLGLTAYDIQRIKAMAADEYRLDKATIARIAILGALNLYLDFINLLIRILIIIGKKKD